MAQNVGGRILTGNQTVTIGDQVYVEVPASWGAGLVDSRTGWWSHDDLVAATSATQSVTWNGPVKPRAYTTGALPTAGDNDGVILANTDLGNLVYSQDGAWQAIKTVRFSNRTITVGSGGDHATLNAALEEANRLETGFSQTTADWRIFIRILSGTTLSEGPISIRKGNWSSVTIVSDDATVPVNVATVSAGLTTSQGSFIEVLRATGPRILETVFSATGSLAGGVTELRGLTISDGATCQIDGSGAASLNTRSAGFEGFTSNVLVSSGATLFARRARFDDATVGVRLATMGRAFMEDCGSNGCTEHSMTVTEGATANLRVRSQVSGFDFTFGDWRKNGTTEAGGSAADIEVTLASTVIGRSLDDPLLAGTNVTKGTVAADGSVFWNF